LIKQNINKDKMNFSLFLLFGNNLCVPMKKEVRKEEIKEENIREKWIDPHVGFYC